MKRTAYLLAALVLFVAANAGAQAELSIRQYPKLDLENPDQDENYITDEQIQNVEDDVNKQIKTLADQAVEDANKEIGDFGDLPLLAQGFGNASVYASSVATQRPYPDYRSFYLNLGTSTGAQAPESYLTNPEALPEDLRSTGDMYVGATWQMWSLSLGLKLGFISDKLYLGGKFGSMEQTFDVEGQELTVSADTIGLFAHYRVLDTLWSRGPFRWRGLAFGSGIVHHGAGIDLRLKDLGTFSQSLGTGAELFPEELNMVLEDQTDYSRYDEVGTLLVSPSLSLGTVSSIYTVPLELSTALRLLWLLDLSVGAGVDLSFGSSTVNVAASGLAAAEGYVQESQYMQVSDGEAALTSSTTAEPSFVRPRVTAAASVNLGPLKVSVPVAYYFDADTLGLSAGVNVGILW